MNSHGVRPNKLWHWFAVAFLAATFLAEPRAFIGVTWQLFRGAGAIGGELLTGGSDSDVLNLDDEGDQGEPVDSNQPAPPSTDQPGVHVDANGIRTALDSATDLVLDLHDHVVDIQQAGGFTVTVGNPNPSSGDDGS